MKGRHFRKNNSIKTTSIILSVITIIELIILLTTMTFSWFEGLTSLEIKGDGIATASELKSKFVVGEGTDYQTTAELNEFFHKQSFDKISPVSSYDGDNFYAITSSTGEIPGNYSEYLSAVSSKTATFRKLSNEEKNSSIIQFQFEITSDSSDTDFWFKALPVFSIDGVPLDSENNPFRVCIDDGSGADPNGANNYNMTTRVNWPTGGRSAMRAVKSIDSDGFATLNNPSAGDEITNRADFVVFGTENNNNGAEKLFTAIKGQSKIITISIWLEAFDPAYNESLIPPGATVDINMQFCSSWDVEDTITFRDYTADHWVTNTNGSDTQRLGVVNLDSDNNYYYGGFTFDANTHTWTGKIPRAVQNLKFVWQNVNDSVEDNTWNPVTRGNNTTFTLFGSTACLWYDGDVTRITMNDYTGTHWLHSSTTKMRVQVTYSGYVMDYSMTENPIPDSSGKNTWAAYIPSEVQDVVFNRCNTSNTSTALNTWDAPDRGTETRYYALDGGEVEVIEGTAIYLNIPPAYADKFYYQNYTPAISITSTQNKNTIKNLGTNLGSLDKDAYVTSGSHQDTWHGTNGQMTKVSDTIWVFYFDFNLPDGTYLTFWNRPQNSTATQVWQNLDNHTCFATAVQYSPSKGNMFTLYNPVKLTHSQFVDAYIYSDNNLWKNYNGEGGNTTIPGEKQVGQWGPPALPEGTYQTYFYHTSTTATSVTAKFTYYGGEYEVKMTKSSSDPRKWYTTTTQIPDDAGLVTFTDNAGNTWTSATSGSRSSSTPYYYATSDSTGKWSASITPPTGTYTTYFVPPAGTTVSSVTVSYTYQGVPFSAIMSVSTDGSFHTNAIPNDASNIVFKDTSGHTWTATGTRSSSANYFITTSNSAGAWGKPASDKNIVYLKPGVWNVDGAWYAAYIWNSSGNKWIKMQDSDGDGIYECEIPDGYTNIIFCRMKNTDTSTLDWSNKWNQTNDLTISGSNNLYTISGWGGDKSPGSWSTK